MGKSDNNTVVTPPSDVLTITKNGTYNIRGYREVVINTSEKEKANE